MRYFVSRQYPWMTSDNVVEIAAGGLDHSGPDMLCTRYGALGEGLETSDPREALGAAVAIRNKWNIDLLLERGYAFPCAHIEVGYNLDMVTPTEELTDEQLHEWAQAEWEATPKCYWCNEVVESPYYISEFGEDVQFCSERCADECWAEEVCCEDK